jgi:hypothetical protein
LLALLLLNGRDMNDRRSYGRVRFLEPVGGTLRDFSNVVVLQKNGGSEWIAISRQAVVAGEMLFLDIEDDGSRNEVAVCAVDNRPVIRDGDLRYRIRLRRQDDDEALVRFEQQVRRG